MIRVEPAGPDGAAFEVWASPGASREGVRGERDGALRVAVAAPAERGRANEALVRLLARALGVRPGELSIESGARARAKRVVARSLDAGALEERLAGLLAGKSMKRNGKEERP